MSINPKQFLIDHLGKPIKNSPFPFMNWLAPVVENVGDPELTFSYIVRKEMTNGFNIVHGGIIASIIDDIIGATLICYAEPFQHITLNLNIDYFFPAKQYDKIIAISSVVKKGSTIVNAQCEIWNQEKTRLLAKGTTNLLKLTLEQNLF